MGISVIIPAYKARKYLPECLESISHQTLAPTEVLVIDDSSPEPVDVIVAAFSANPENPPIRLLRHKVNLGQAAGRNTGIKASDSEWFAFIDCDDVWAPDHLEQAMATLKKSGADLAFCPATIFDQDINCPLGFTERPMTPEEEAISPLALLGRCFIIMSSVVARPSAIRAFGGFEEDNRMRAVEDLDCFMKLLKAGAKFSMSERPTLFYRKHPESATCTKGYMVRQTVHVTEQHIGWIEASSAAKRRLLGDVCWRASILTSQLNAKDRRDWLIKALRVSALNPILLGKWMARYVKHCLIRN